MDWSNGKKVRIGDPRLTKVPQETMILIEWECQIGIEIPDYTGDKISVGVARPSHVLGQSVPCDGQSSVSGTRVQRMCTESGIRAQGLITRVTAS